MKEMVVATLMSHISSRLLLGETPSGDTVGCQVRKRKCRRFCRRNLHRFSGVKLLLIDQDVFIFGKRMATSTSNSSESTDRILVRGVPSSSNADKLTIQFQKRKTGGGDVKAVTFPVSSKEADTAIIVFEEPATVLTVLRHDHIIAGKKLTVTALEPQPKIFEKVVGEISSLVMKTIKTSGEDIDSVFENISDATGCTIDKNGQAYEVKGEWYQVQASFDILQGLVSGGKGKDSVAPPLPTPSVNGYLSSNVTPKPNPVPRRNVVSCVWDKDIFAYAEKVRKNDLEKIKATFGVNLQGSNMGSDATKIEVIPTSDSSDPEKAVKQLEELSQTIQSDAGQEIVDIDFNISASSLDAIFAQLQPEFPEAHMGRVDTSPDKIIIVAPNGEKCRMAKEMLQHFLNAAKQSPAPNAAAGGNNKIDVDKDIFEFMLLTMKGEMDRLWNSCGVKVNATEIGDCLKIEFVSDKEAKMPYRPDAAIDRFQKMYNTVNDKAQQDTFDLGKLAKLVSKEKVASALRKVKTFHKRVHISQMLTDMDQILFIAETKENCDSAMKIFKALLESDN